MLGAAHAWANPLTATFGIVHGHAVGLMLPHVVRFNSNNSHFPYADLEPDAQTLASKLVAILTAAKLPRRLSDCSITDLPLKALFKAPPRNGPPTSIPESCRPTTSPSFTRWRSRTTALRRHLLLSNTPLPTHSANQPLIAPSNSASSSSQTSAAAPIASPTVSPLQRRQQCIFAAASTIRRTT